MSGPSTLGIIKVTWKLFSLVKEDNDLHPAYLPSQGQRKVTKPEHNT